MWSECIVWKSQIINKNHEYQKSSLEKKRTQICLRPHSLQMQSEFNSPYYSVRHHPKVWRRTLSEHAVLAGQKRMTRSALSWERPHTDLPVVRIFISLKTQSLYSNVFVLIPGVGRLDLPLGTQGLSIINRNWPKEVSVPASPLTFFLSYLVLGVGRVVQVWEPNKIVNKHTNTGLHWAGYVTAVSRLESFTVRRKRDSHSTNVRDASFRQGHQRKSRSFTALLRARPK